MTSVRFPGESDEYRAARQQLLNAEAALRQHTEDVAIQRRSLPLGGALKEDYLFETMDGDAVRVSELFRPGKDTLVVYNYMYGPSMKSPCVMCTSILDGLDGQVQHITQRVNLAVVAKSPAARIRDVQRGRGWRYLPLLSSAGNTYNADYFGENEKGAQLPMLNVCSRSATAASTTRMGRNCCTHRIPPAWIHATSIRSGRCGTCST